MNKPVYLDYNATTPIAAEVMDEMLPFLYNSFGNPSSSYSIGRKNKEAIINARQQVAHLLNANPDEIIFTSGGTESNNHAIRGIANANQDKGKHIITSAIEHPAVTEVCNYLHSHGYEISYIPVDTNGVVYPEDVENAIRKDTTLISIMHANNETGSIQPIEEIGEIAKKHNIAFHTDAAQSVGKIETDVTKLGVDLLTIAGHKLYAPKGIGALYINRETTIENLMYGASQEKGLRPGTENVPYIVALGKACEIAKRDFDKTVQIMKSTKEKLLNGLINKLGTRVQVNGQLSNTLPNTLSLAFERTDAHTLASMISNEVLISTGSACHADSIEISSVLKAMKVNQLTAASTVRLSTGRHTTFREIEKAVDVISNIVLKF
ncbi:MAG: cysteine desulfurase family protein [Bacteroidota bacterium]